MSSDKEVEIGPALLGAVISTSAKGNILRRRIIVDMRRVFLSLNVFGLLVFCALPAGAQDIITVNQGGSADHDNLNDAIDALGASGTWTIQFTDTSPVTYTLADHKSMPDNVDVEFDPQTAGVITVEFLSGSNGMNVATGGAGTFTAHDLTFTGTANFLVSSYDGCTLTNVTFRDSNDNGLAIRFGINTLTNCTFDNNRNMGMEVTGGTTECYTCNWTDNGRCFIHAMQDGVNPPGLVTLHGGTGSGDQFDRGFESGGCNLIVNGFTTTGLSKAVVRDFENDAIYPFYFEANNCTFNGTYDRIVEADINGPAASTLTFNNCSFTNSELVSADVIVIDGRNNGEHVDVILNACTVRYSNSTGGTAVACWSGGTLSLNNTLIDGAGNSIICNSQTGSATAAVEVNHCVFVNNTDTITSIGENPNTHITIRNSIIDSSNAGGIGIPDSPDITRVVEYNVINVSGSYDGTNVVTGDPNFIAPGADNYHILAPSVAANAGVVTTLVVDVDGEARPKGGPNPDIGLDEINEGGSATTFVDDWQGYR